MTPGRVRATPKIMLADHVLALANPEGPLWADAARIESKVFQASGYGSEAELAAEYAPYDSQSTFLLVVRDRVAVGSARIIRPNPLVGFKTVSDVKSGRLEIRPDASDLIFGDHTDALEVGSLSLDTSVVPALKDQGAAGAALYGAVVGFARLLRAKTLLASFDEQYFERFLRSFGPNAGHTLGPAVDYMGSPTVAVAMHVEQMLDSASRHRPSLFASIEANAARLQLVLDSSEELLLRQRAYAAA
jgi:hypothetical protein